MKLLYRICIIWQAYTFIAVLTGMFTPVRAAGQSAGPDTLSPGELKKFELEELVDMEITSVSKRPERLSEAAASVQVITQEDIRRSGATSLPEALRLAPNLRVAQVDARQWAVSARGFNTTTANKLLVLIDGRSVYTPLYSGVFWDVQDAFLEDVERIEVISGPGGTLWGANAVNGVIHIITKSAKERNAQGMLLYSGVGTEERAQGGVRYGGRAGQNAYSRVYLKHFNREDSRLSDGREARDAWHVTQGGFRADLDASNRDLLTFQGDVYRGNIDQPTNSDIFVAGGNLTGRWSRTFSTHSSLKIQMYYDWTRRRIPGTFSEDLHTLDFDVQHRHPLGGRQDMVWGFDFRFSNDQVGNSASLAFLPAHLNTRLFSGFVQDEIALVKDRLRLTFGSKFEHNDFSGFEVQPSGRLSWVPTGRQTVWAAVSRAVRTPSRIDRDLYAPGTPPHNVLAGGPGFRSEEVFAYELGYRAQPHDRISLDLATFYNVYDGLRSVEPGPPPTLQNGLEGEVYGGRISAQHRLTGRWRGQASYAYLHKRIVPKLGSRDVNRGQGEGNDPSHQFSFHSYLDLPGDLELGGIFRYVSRLPNSNARVPAYATLDVRLGWRPAQNLELSVAGQHLLDDRHPEFGAPATRKEIQRGVYGRTTWRF